MDLRILYENKDLIAVYKPAGIATETRDVLSEDMVSLVRKYAAGKERPLTAGQKALNDSGNRSNRADTAPGSIEPVHRLDQPVSGILIFAKNKESFRKLSAQFSGNKCDKRYLAVVEGAMPLAEGEVHLVHYLKKEISGRGTRAVICEASRQGAKKAELIYKITKVLNDPPRTILEIRLLTGRFHQIRAQLSAIGHPILGDMKYGYQGLRVDSCGIALLCYHIAFVDPGSGKRIELSLDENDPAMVDFLGNYG